MTGTYNAALRIVLTPRRDQPEPGVGVTREGVAPGLFEWLALAGDSFHVNIYSGSDVPLPALSQWLGHELAAAVAWGDVSIQEAELLRRRIRFGQPAVRRERITWRQSLANALCVFSPGRHPHSAADE